MQFRTYYVEYHAVNFHFFFLIYVDKLDHWLQFHLHQHLHQLIHRQQPERHVYQKAKKS